MKFRFVLAAVMGLAVLAGDAPTIAIMPIKGHAEPSSSYSGEKYNGDIQRGLPNIVNQRLETRIVMAFLRSKKFQVLERTNLDKLLAEGRFSKSIWADDNRSVAIGKQLGAKFIVMGEFSFRVNGITHLVHSDSRDCDGSMALVLRVVNTETGAICDVFDVAAETTGKRVMESMDALLDGIGIKLEENLAGPLVSLEPEKA